MVRPYIFAELRRLVADRASGYCEYCKFPVKFASESMEIDHTFPVSLGGKTVAENLALACHGCNQHKQNRIEGVDLLSSISAGIYRLEMCCCEDWSEADRATFIPVQRPRESRDLDRAGGR
jgi:HNH endonuclease